MIAEKSKGVKRCHVDILLTLYVAYTSLVVLVATPFVCEGVASLRAVRYSYAHEY